jgi:hypothetical protein
VLVRNRELVLLAPGNELAAGGDGGVRGLLIAAAI